MKIKERGTEVLTLRLDLESKAALGELAAAMDRGESYLVNGAVKEFLETRRRRIAEIRAGIKEAEAGRFAAPGKVDAFFKKWRAI
ncbi:MAG: CopG family ribbon-helix-helix protein [bacterium]